MKFEIDTTNWQFYLTRPFDLFSTSLWQGWYESEHMQNALGFKMNKVICIEISHHLVSQYRRKDQLRELDKSFRQLLSKKPKKLISLLKHGINLGNKAVLYIKNGPKSFRSFDEAIRFFNEVIFYTTVFPNFPSIFLKDKETLPKKISKLCSKLRLTSFYPQLIKKIIIPLALKHLRDRGINSNSKILSLLTLNELFSGDIKNIIRQREKLKGKNFIYEKIKKKESVTWSSNVGRFIKKIDANNGSRKKGVAGLSTYFGKVTGNVHLVLDFTKPGLMKKGQVLVSINCNPYLMPAIRKASALVTDEGGITCHAAIISRELKIPCIIGTKVATKVFKDGDLVEVDANKGTIRRVNP